MSLAVVIPVALKLEKTDRAMFKIKLRLQAYISSQSATLHSHAYLTKIIEIPFVPTPGIVLCLDNEEIYIEPNSVFYDVKTQIFEISYSRSSTSATRLEAEIKQLVEDGWKKEEEDE